MNRREFIGVGAAAIAGCSGKAAPPPASERLFVPTLREERPVSMCPRPAHQTAGPFYQRELLWRANIAEGQPGRPLELRFMVVDEAKCAAISGVTVSVFHANADGLYSGFAEQGEGRDQDTSGASWLRGAQTSDAAGEVAFESIYPGWYTGRVTHLHLSALSGEKLLFSTQIYFPDPLMREVYADAPYHGWRDTEDDTDLVRKRAVRGVLPRFAIERGGAKDIARVTLSLKARPENGAG